MSPNAQKIMIPGLTIAFTAVLGITVIRYQLTEMFRLRATWRSTTLHVYSGKDGPWVITHLVKLRKGTDEYAVASLPSPVAIVDSRGENFTTNFLQSLTWISHSGETSSPPSFGHPMRVFYFVPEHSR